MTWNGGTLNTGMNRQGLKTIAGRTTRTRLLDDDQRLGQSDREDSELRSHLTTDIDVTIGEIMREVESMHWHKQVKPFVEGEAIGALPRRVRSKVTDKMCREYHNTKMEDDRDRMLMLRKRNDETLRQLKEKR